MEGKNVKCSLKEMYRGINGTIFLKIKKEIR